MNLISLSLWGDAELYTLGALANARLAPAIYPGWAIRFYCGTEVPVIDELRRLGADVRVMPASPRYAGLFWRFLPAADAGFEHVVIRDADSRLNLREKAAVDAWIASGQPFHVMRDHPHHRHAPILGGMWGCRGGSIPDIDARIARFEDGASKHEDTRFLRDEIWPIVRDRSVVHSSVPDPLGGTAFPEHAPYPGHVGEIISARIEDRATIAVLIPSRGRPAGAHAAALSARAAASAPERLQLLVGVEPDEATTYRTEFGEDSAWVHVLEAGGNYARAIRELHRAASASIHGLLADDFIFETSGWDNRVRDAVADLPHRLGVVYGDDGLQGERLATAPFLTSEWIRSVGEILPGKYAHLFCDTELTDIARFAGLLQFLPHLKITHRHYLTGGSAFDATYERSATTWDAGQKEFDHRGPARERLARRLARMAGRQLALAARRLPSASHQLLLIAGCRRDDGAVRAWDDWMATTGLERADVSSTRLFPLIWWNLERSGISPGRADVLKPHYTNSWAASHALADGAASIARTLAASDIPVIFVGGVVLAHRYYGAPALRPSQAVDVIVATRDEKRTRRVLDTAKFPVSYRVHTHVLPAGASSRDRGIWERANVFDIGGAAMRVLSPADELLRTSVRAFTRGQGAGMWAADLVALIRKADAPVDWNVLVEEARARRRAVEVAAALDYVRITFGADVPEAVCRRLNGRRAPRRR